MASEGNKINQYTCQTCNGVITTIDRDYGTTPATLTCRATEGCSGRMYSSLYRVDQSLVPDHEFYKPEKMPRDRGMREHVERGGLMFREISS